MTEYVKHLRPVNRQQKRTTRKRIRKTTLNPQTGGNGRIDLAARCLCRIEDAKRHSHATGQGPKHIPRNARANADDDEDEGANELGKGDSHDLRTVNV